MKTIFITGSTDGIGKLAAQKLATAGHQLLIHGRNPEKLETALSEIKQLTGNNQLRGFLSDLSDFASIKRMIDDLSKEVSTIDVLINNAGVYESQKAQNKNGLDMRFAVNYFAPVMLTNQLLPFLDRSASPRIINLSSAAQDTVSMDALIGKKQLSSNEAYAQSKLAFTMWSFDFAKKHPKINTIAVNPGSLLNTKMVQEAFGKYWSSADKGADILVELATSEKHAANSGKYYDNDKGAFSDAHADAYDSRKIDLLISETDKVMMSQKMT